MTEKKDLLSAKEVAAEKGVSFQAVYQAIHRGALNTQKIGSMYAVIRDEAFEAYQPKKHEPSND